MTSHSLDPNVSPAAAPPGTFDFVSIVMPALNEARHIAQAIASIEPRGAKIGYEILVMDGGSSDGTQAIVAALAQGNLNLRLVANPKRTQAAALNLAVEVADPRSQVILRADCHADYPAGFVETCLGQLRLRDCASVVVPMLTVGRTCMQKAIASAQNSRLGNGGSAHRLAGSSGYVEHGHHAAFLRSAFVAAGGYDETMLANEDAELDRRLTAQGHRIWLCGEATIDYFPRATLKALARQYFGYGRGRALTCLRHRVVPKARQILPFGVFLACIGSLTLALVDMRFLAVAGLYAALCIGWGALLALRNRSLCDLMSGPAAMSMHLAWGAGFLAGLLGWSGVRTSATG